MQELEIRQDGRTPNDAAHSTNLYYIPSLLTEEKRWTSCKNSPANNGMEVRFLMATRWQPKVPSRFRGMLRATLVPEMGRACLAPT